MPNRAVPITLALGLLAARASSEVPVGPEFQVNSYTTGNQAGLGGLSAAFDANGSFVVVWGGEGQDGSGFGVFARRYDASGATVGPAEFQVNSYTTGHQDSPAVASDANGRLVVVWRSGYQDGSGTGVFARQYDATGTPGSEFRVNSHTLSSQRFPAVASDENGRFVVVWDSVFNQDGDSYGVFAQRYDASGTPQGGEFQVNSYTTSGQTQPSVASDAVGNFVVAWFSDGQDGSGYGVFAQRYDVSGAALGGEFQVNSYTTGAQRDAAVASDPSGNFFVVWSDDRQDGSSFGVFGRRYDTSGTPQGGEFRVNSYTTNLQRSPAVTSDPNGNFIVSWTSSGQDGSSLGVFAQRYDVSGAPQGSEFRVNSYTTGDQRASSVASGATNGRLVAAWESGGQDGSGTGVFAQRFEPDLIFKDGFETAGMTTWSTYATDGGDLSVSAGAALNLTPWGLQGVVDDTAGIYVQDESPNDETRYRARFYFDTNGFDPGEAQAHFRTRTFIVFSENPARRVAALVLRRQSGVFSVMGRARLDDNSQEDTGFFTMTDAPHSFEIELVRASRPDAMDGVFRVWGSGFLLGELTGLDNSLSEVDFVRLGALSVKTGASGTLYWDEFESRRESYIGP